MMNEVKKVKKKEIMSGKEILYSHININLKKTSIYALEDTETYFLYIRKE